MDVEQEPDASLPIRRSLTPVYATSLVIAILMAAASVAGLVYRAIVYPTEELSRTFVPNDVVNLLVGLPILLGSIWQTKRGKLIGLLCWPGALFFVLYNYSVYVFAMPLNAAFVLQLVAVTLSLYAMLGLWASIDGEAVRNRLAGKVPEKLAGGVLAGLGLLFLLRVIGVVAWALRSQMPVSGVELALHTADFLMCPAWIVVGILLWRRRVLGYVMGLGLLFQASMLFMALIVLLMLQPLLSTAPFALGDVVAIFIMGLICFVPLVLYGRGVVKRSR